MCKFNWNVEELKLMNMQVVDGVFDCEDKVSREDKIAFIDSMQDGAMSYIVSVGEKFLAEKDTLKTDECGNIKTVSLRAWVNRNDKKDKFEEQGMYEVLRLRANIKNYPNVHPIWSRDNKDIVDAAFNAQLQKCLEKEKCYFYENDTNNQLAKMVCQKMVKYGYDFGYTLTIEGGYLVPKDYRYGVYAVEFTDWDDDSRYLTPDELIHVSELLDTLEDSYIKVQKAQEEFEEATSKFEAKLSAVVE